MSEMSAAEAEVVARFDAAEPAPESWRGDDGLARRFHETYERLAPSFGYETRRESAVPWEDVPEQNRRLMVAVCEEVTATLRAKAASADRVRELANEMDLRADAKSTHPMPGYDEGYREGLSDGESYAADRIRRALDDPC